MYTEFIVIYIGLALNIILTAITLFMVIKTKTSSIKKSKKGPKNSYFDDRSSEVITICKKCALQYDAKLKKCPKCGTPKK
ncbi:MAG: hypothetical protein IJK60_04265 [Clostridia bacterium]|nr:hypothetical protein [Clostridia bacterium]